MQQDASVSGDVTEAVLFSHTEFSRNNIRLAQSMAADQADDRQNRGISGISCRPGRCQAPGGAGLGDLDAARDFELVASGRHGADGEATRAFWAPMPPWVTAQTARSRTGPCGTKHSMWALSGYGVLDASTGGLGGDEPAVVLKL
jgi:hypothetical protein